MQLTRVTRILEISLPQFQLFSFIVDSNAWSSGAIALRRNFSTYYFLFKRVSYVYDVYVYVP